MKYYLLDIPDAMTINVNDEFMIENEYHEGKGHIYTVMYTQSDNVVHSVEIVMNHESMIEYIATYTITQPGYYVFDIVSSISDQTYKKYITVL